MKKYKSDKFTVSINKDGEEYFTKVSYPVRYGRFSEIITSDYIYQFNLNGEIKYIKGRGSDWQNPSEWLKRTVANDWVYYSTGGYNGLFETIGEYYIPCFSYPTNSFIGGKPFTKIWVQKALTSFLHLQKSINELLANTEKKALMKMPDNVKNFLLMVSENNNKFLKEKACKFHNITSGIISVLPPDTRHVDYEIIPIAISDGCLYNCGFCRIKSGNKFQTRSKVNIKNQIQQLKNFYNKDIKNYNSIFLGQHDALFAGKELICYAATETFNFFNFKNSYLKTPRLFLFGSVDSFINASDGLFDDINKLPYLTYINLGLESADSITLSLLKKPISVKKVLLAFNKMIAINKKYSNIEITANFIMDDSLPDTHYQSLDNLFGNSMKKFYNKGTIYFSPLNCSGNSRSIIHKFHRFKLISCLPTYIYLIQRL